MAIDRRTCKHLRAERGSAAETARVAGQVTPAPNPTPAPQPTSWAGSLAASAKAKPAVPATTSVWAKLGAFDDVFDEKPEENSDEKPEPPPAEATGEASEPSTKKEGFAVLLAETWDATQDPTGWLMSEKLDGVRAYWDGKDFISRLGNVFQVPDWYKNQMPKFDLDGEFWMGYGKFQETSGFVRRSDKGSYWTSIKYMVFDAPGTGAFENRLNLAARWQEHQPKDYPPQATIVPHIICSGHAHLRSFLDTVERKGGEGVMLRQPGSNYVRARSSTLLKVKSFFDADAIIVGHSPGKGRHRGRLGAYECETTPSRLQIHGKSVSIQAGRRFNVGTGLSDNDRSIPFPTGTIITYRFQELTAAGIPRFPSFVGRRGDV